MNTSRIFLALLILFSSCKKDELENITFNSPEKEYKLVVEGGINTFQKIQYIRLSEPTFSIYAISEPAKGASVVVNDGDKNITFKETSTPGIYSGTINNNANYNKPYKLIINYKSKQYTAVDTLRQVVNVIDDFLPLGCLKLPNGKIQLTIPKHTFGFLHSCKWLISYTGIPVWNPAKFDASQYYSYTHAQGSPNSIYPLLNLTRKVELPPAEMVSFYKFSMSESYSKYLYSVFQETDWKGIFSSVPGEIKGNISSGAVGFFYVIDVDLRKYKASELAK